MKKSKFKSRRAHKRRKGSSVLERLHKPSAIAKRRLRVANEQIPIQEHWIGWFLERGNMAMAEKQRKVVDKLYRRRARLETYLARKS